MTTLTETQVPLELYQWAAEVERIGNRAVREAQEESRRMGVPNVYSINGIIYYELPNGELTREDPWHGSDTNPNAPTV
jgi:hypothetical protein